MAGAFGRAWRLLACMAWLLALGPAQAEGRALLVGVSGYPGLPERLRLQGPRNDVLRMREVLLGRGFAAAQVRLLADGVPGAGLPTRANVLAALADLAREARAGDTVVLHFAGHGSQQPGDDADGLDETFLPLDVGRWDGGRQTVANALVKHELRAAVDRIGASGAFVWAVFDACHSATLVRGEGTGGGEAAANAVRWRGVAPAELGVPEAAARPRATRPRADAAERDAPPPVASGRTAFFYATQTRELTPELWLPPAAPRRQPHGLFSFVIARAVERGVPMSYRQLAQAVLADYAHIPEARATPLFSGSGLDAPVLGQAVPPLRQWPLLQDAAAPAVGAGALSGVAPGAVFAAVPGPLAPAGEVLGHLEATEVDTAHSRLRPVAFAGRAAPDARALPAGAWLRLVHEPLAYGLRVALLPGCGACPLQAAVARLQADGVPGVDLQWVDAGASPDLQLAWRGGRAWVEPVSALPGEAVAVGGTRDELAARLARVLHAMARVRNLLRLAARDVSQGRPPPLAVSLRRSSGAEIPPEQVPELRGGDLLELQVRNPGDQAQDLTVLYLDAAHGIGVLYPSRAGESNRIEPGARQVIDGIRIQAPPAGLEHLLLITAAARPQAERSDFSFLQQPPGARVRGGAAADPPSNPPSNPHFDPLADAAFADYRRRGGGGPAVPPPATRLMTYTLRVR